MAKNRFAAYADSFSRSEMEKALRRIIQLECHMIDRGEEPPGGRSDISMESRSDPRTRIRRERPENGVMWRLVYDPSRDTGGSSYCWYAYQCILEPVISRKPDLVDSQDYRWYSRVTTYSAESALEHILRENNGIEIDPKYALLKG